MIASLRQVTFYLLTYARVAHYDLVIFYYSE